MFALNESPTLRSILDDLATGRVSAGAAEAMLRELDAQPLGFATVDHRRAERCGAAEVIFAAGKTAEQVVAIAGAILDRHHGVLITRASGEQLDAVEAAFTDRPMERGRLSGTMIVGRPSPMRDDLTPIPVVTAGTSDLPVAEEAAMTIRAKGQRVVEVNDVGVAGLHRILGRVEAIRAGNVVIVVAGMEGALPSVVGGLVDKPVIAVPTSVGYGASFGGVAALLGMLNSCASGVTVVNIDNGFGAGFAAARINRLTGRDSQDV